MLRGKKDNDLILDEDPLSLVPSFMSFPVAFSKRYSFVVPLLLHYYFPIDDGRRVA